MSNDNVTSALLSIDSSLDVSGQYGKDASEGAEVAKTIQNVEIKRNEQGKWEKSVTDQDFPAKKDITARADELAFYENSVQNLTTIAGNADKKLYDTINEINNKKQIIISTIASAVSSGCSCVVGTAIANGVTIGIGSTVFGDYASIKQYSNIGTNSQNPFGTSEEAELSTSTLGTGYKTQYEINSLDGTNFGLYRVVNGLTALNLPSTTCAGYKTIIDNAGTDIGNLRGTISNQLITDTNKVKDQKTNYQVYVWSYKVTDKEISQITSQENTVKSVIQSQTGFQ